MLELCSTKFRLLCSQVPRQSQHAQTSSANGRKKALQKEALITLHWLKANKRNLNCNHVSILHLILIEARIFQSYEIKKLNQNIEFIEKNFIKHTTKYRKIQKHIKYVIYSITLVIILYFKYEAMYMYRIIVFILFFIYSTE